MSFLKRAAVGAGLAALGTLIAGPAGAYAGWKLGGVAATGNLLHLVPGGGFWADGMDIAADVVGFGDLADTADVHGSDVHGNDRTNTIWGTHPTDVQQNDPRVDIVGNPPRDIHGNLW